MSACYDFVSYGIRDSEAKFSLLILLTRDITVHPRISRYERPADSAVHFFTSDFYTTLSKNGLSAVTSRTTKKGINIFTKHFIFVPVNQSLHWSLCVIVHPGLIRNGVQEYVSNVFCLVDNSLEAYSSHFFPNCFEFTRRQMMMINGHSQTRRCHACSLWIR